MSQPAKRARFNRSNNDDDEGYEPSSSEATQSRKQSSGSALWADDDQMGRLVKDVVRYILACEHKKVLIRKDDINKKVLHEYSRQYNQIFKQARDQLSDTFGMGLLEIPEKDIKGKNKPILTGASSQQQQPTTTTTTTQPKPASSHTYILYNCLNKDLEAYKVIHQTDENYASMGLLYYMLAIILVNEQELREGELLSYLASTNLEKSSDTFGDLDTMLALYVKQGYLQRFKEPMEDKYTYQWGPRAKSEISYKDMASFMASISQPENEDEFNKGVFKSAGF